MRWIQRLQARLIRLRLLLQGSGKLPSQGSAGKVAEGGKKEGAGRIHMGKAGSIACLEELEAAGKKKQMIEWSSDQYAARCVSCHATSRYPTPDTDCIFWECS